MTDTPSPSTTAEQEPTTAAPAPRRKFLDLSMTQVIAGSMAAATAAALGSKLGVAGTIIGAAVASVIAAVASAVFFASLDRTQHGVRRVLRRPTTTTETRPAAGTAAAPATPAEAEPVPAATTLQPAGGARTAGAGWFASPRGQQVRGVLVGAVGAFAIAAVGITGYEFVSGSSVSGGDGTTIQRVVVHRTLDPSDSGDPAPGSGQGSPQQQDEGPAGTESDAPTTEDEPTTSPTEEPSDSPTTSPSEDPTEPEGSTGPTSEPTPSAPESSAPSESPDESSQSPSSEKPSTSQRDAQQDSQRSSQPNSRAGD